MDHMTGWTVKVHEDLVRKWIMCLSQEFPMLVISLSLKIQNKYVTTLDKENKKIELITLQ